MPNSRVFAMCLFAVLLSVPCFAKPQDEENRPRVIPYEHGEYQVQQLISPSFSQLPLGRKLFAYHLARAIDATDDIAWMQLSRDGLAIRNLLEKLWPSAARLTPVEKQGLSQYLFKLNNNHCNYDAGTNEKFVLEGFTTEEFLAFVQSSHQDVVEARRLIPALFNRDYQRIYRAKGTDDLVSNSASNFYGPGVTKSQVDALPQDVRNNFLNYPYLDKNGQVQIQLQRIGERFDRQLRAAEREMTLAAQYGTREEKAILAAYIQAFQSGDEADLTHAEALWAQYKPTDLDFTINFVETYDDPLGIHGTWEGFLVLLAAEPETAERIAKIRAHFDEFEKRTPVAPEFKRAPGGIPPKAEGTYRVYGGGRVGDYGFAGVNLPNNRGLKDAYGSKSYSFLNAIKETSGAAKEMKSSALPFFAPQYREDVQKFNNGLTYQTHVEFHEILGHGSGQDNPGVKNSDLGTFYSPLEEGRAETAAVDHMIKPYARDIGVLPKEWSDEEFLRFAEFNVVRFFTNHLRSYYGLGDDTEAITQAHQFARQAMLNFMLAHNAIEVRESSEGLPQVYVTDLERARQTLDEFWNLLQTARSTGNYEMAEEIFDQWGRYGDIHKKWREALKAETIRQGIPKHVVYMNPVMVPVKNAEGKISDVQLRYEQPSDSLDFFINSKIAMRKRCRDILAGGENH